jgi:hypothetical protein
MRNLLELTDGEGIVVADDDSVSDVVVVIDGSVSNVIVVLDAGSG